MAGAPMEGTKWPGIYVRHGVRGDSFIVRYRPPKGGMASKTFKTAKLAREFQASVSTDIKRGEFQAPSRITVQAAAEEWLATLENHAVRDRTRAHYRRDLDRCVAILNPRTRLVDLSTRDLADLRDRLRDKGGPKGTRLTITTVKRVMQPVRSMLDYYTERGVLRVNPARGLKANRGARAESRKARALSDDELRALLRAVPEGQGRVLLQFLAGTGVRISEALAVTWSDVWWDRGIINIDKQAPASRGGRPLPPKTEKRVRQVPLSVELAKVLDRHRTSCRWSDDADLLFASQTGGYLAQNNLIRRTLKPAATKAGLVEEVENEKGEMVLRAWPGFHTLRHTYASRALRAGWDLARLSATLGHSSIAFTLDRYSHFIDREAPETSFIDAGIRV